MTPLPCVLSAQRFLAISYLDQSDTAIKCAKYSDDCLSDGFFTPQVLARPVFFTDVWNQLNPRCVPTSTLLLQGCSSYSSIVVT
jgi:hypothetical protein